jgi:hypothetical protein
MPLLLEPVDVVDQLGDARSVLIASCPVCPAFSLSMNRASPLFGVERGVPRMMALKEHVAVLRQALEARGMRTDTFTTYAPLPMMCLWTEGQRNRLTRRAGTFDVLLVLGCDSAAYTAKRALEGTRCRVVQAMRMIGITNAEVGYQAPMKLVLEQATRVPVKVKDPQTDSHPIERNA